MISAALVVLAVLSGDVWAEAEKAPSPEEVVSASSDFVPGKGFRVAESELGSLNIGAYVLLRYLNQLPAEQSFIDHLGRERTIDLRNDIELHRILIHFKGFLFSPKFTHQTSVWAVNSTGSVTAISALSYEFGKGFILGGGIGAIPGTRSLNYEHPYFLGTDRQLADEFFRPSFSSGIWAEGEALPKVNYRVMMASALSMVDISAAQLTRDMFFGGTLSWLPTTGEFGPKGGFGDFEMHDNLATRFGVSAVTGRPDRFSEINNPQPDNTSVRLSDSVLLFAGDALAPGVTVQKADYMTLALDASAKYKGLFFLGEVYFRKLDNFLANGPLPLDKILDKGYMLQASYMVVPEKFEVYGSNSYIFGYFNDSWELGGGLNYFPFKTRNFKVNGSVMYVDRSAYSSYFGYYVGGQKGPTIALCTDFFF